LPGASDASARRASWKKEPAPQIWCGHAGPAKSDSPVTRTTFTTNEPRARVRGRLARGVIVAVGMSLAMPVAADPLGPNALLVRGKK
jgi:hypothetical protein